MVLSYLSEFLTAEELDSHFGEHRDFLTVYALLKTGNGILTSSCGRLCDTVACLLGLFDTVTLGQLCVGAVKINTETQVFSS